MKLHPPVIDGKLPAFAGTSMNIPFMLNRAVALSDLNEATPLKLKIKTVKTNREIGTFSGQYIYNKATGNYHANFILSEKKNEIKFGTFYKVQIAFVSKDNTVGYYSTVGIIKCTTYPIVKVQGQSDNLSNSYEYVGVYQQPSEGNKYDTTEKAYSYCFELRDIDGNIVSTSGTQIHNSSYDTEPEEMHDHWVLRKNLKEGVPYYLTYKVTTTNGLECESQSYPIVTQESVDSSLQEKCDLIATSNFEDGFIRLSLRPKVKHGVIDGSFVLSRSSSEDNFDSWNEIYRFSYKNLHVYGDIGESADLLTTHPDFWDKNDLILWEDFTVQQGVQYVYSIQAFNAQGLFSNRMINHKWTLAYRDNDMNAAGDYEEPDGYDEYRRGYYFDSTPETITVDFEDMFLFDGSRQLKIRFNPKVTSFKSTVLESKIDTLGGKYPFVFRNGNVEYKEFPVSGLLSLISDPNEFFLKGIQTEKLLYRSQANGDEIIGPGDTHVTMDNLRREREFKMEALSWLTNGKPKLFRSPSEGNFIVRIMNVSMSPLDVVGRMLHSFSGTAYEIAECTFDNLNTYGFISAPDRDNRDLKIGQIRLADAADPKKDVQGFSAEGNKITTPAIYRASFTGVAPGTIFALNFEDGYGNVEIEIGYTGTYYVQVQDKPITSITLLKSADIDKLDYTKKPETDDWRDAYLTFCYYDSNPTDNFSKITSIAVQDEFRQFIGTGFNANLISFLEDIRRQTGRFHYLRISERPIRQIYKDSNGVWFFNPQFTDRIYDTEWDASVIYQVGNSGTYYSGKPRSPMGKPDYRLKIVNGDGEYEDEIKFDGRKSPGIELDKWWPTNSYNNGRINKSSGTHSRIDAITGVDKIDGIYIGTGLMVEMAYRVKFLGYDVETSSSAVRNAKATWQAAIENWEAVTGDAESTREQIDASLQQIESAYAKYIEALEYALAQEVED